MSVVSGLVLVDKEQGWTSHDAVARTRRIMGTRKVGHAGTLDPMATGLLILGVNSSTRLLTYVVGLDKEYQATIRLGASTTTDDAEGELSEPAPAASVAAVTAEAIEHGIGALTGEIDQRPSAVSAIKVDGKRAYARVRAGEEVELAARRVTVSVFDLVSTTPADGYLDLEVRVVCSSGTYIRALARDLGAALGVGGHLTRLRRTRVGPFLVDSAPTLGTLAELSEGGLAATILTPADAAGRLFPRFDLSKGQAIDLMHGKRLAFGSEGDVAAPRAAGPIAAIDPDGRLVGLIERKGDTGRILVNFPPDETKTSPSETGATP